MRQSPWPGDSTPIMKTLQTSSSCRAQSLLVPREATACVHRLPKHANAELGSLGTKKPPRAIGYRHRGIIRGINHRVTGHSLHYYRRFTILVGGLRRCLLFLAGTDPQVLDRIISFKGVVRPQRARHRSSARSLSSRLRTGVLTLASAL